MRMKPFSPRYRVYLMRYAPPGWDMQSRSADGTLERLIDSADFCFSLSGDFAERTLPVGGSLTVSRHYTGTRGRAPGVGSVLRCSHRSTMARCC